jgi:hypothetical protein
VSQFIFEYISGNVTCDKKLSGNNFGCSTMGFGTIITINNIVKAPDFETD